MIKILKMIGEEPRISLDVKSEERKRRDLGMLFSVVRTSRFTEDLSMKFRNQVGN